MHRAFPLALGTLALTWAPALAAAQEAAAAETAAEPTAEATPDVPPDGAAPTPPPAGAAATAPQPALAATVDDPPHPPEDPNKPPVEAPEHLPAVAANEAAPEEEEPPMLGFSASVELASAYVFRGLNLFGEKQLDANGMLAIGLALSFPGTGVALSYWSAYQWSGRNIDDNAAAGVGAEQDLGLSWEGSFLDELLSVNAGLLWYFYPAATERAAGTALPCWLEPTVSLTVSTEVDVSLLLTYMAGVQEVLQEGSYFYLSPSVSRTFEFEAGGAMTVGAGAGVKLFEGADPEADNAWDVRLDWAWEIPLGETGYFSPNVHLAWTNLSEVAPEDEFVVWVSFLLGLDT